MATSAIENPLRLPAVGALAGLLAGIFVALPATATAHAIVAAHYHPTTLELSPIDLAKMTCCGQAVGAFYVQVLPNFSFGYPLVNAVMGLIAGAGLGVVYVVFRNLLHVSGVLTAAAFSFILAVPFFALAATTYGAQGLSSPWESAFTFAFPPGAIPPYHLPLTYRLLLALPVVAAGIGIAGLAAILDRRLPQASQSAVLSWLYGSLTVIASVGLLFLLVATLLSTGLVQLGD